MGRPTIPGIYPGKDGRWHVDKVYRGHRLPRRSFESHGEAEGWVIEQLGSLKLRRPGTIPTFDQAAAYYVEKHAEKVSLELDIYLLDTLIPYVGELPIDQLDNEALEPYVKARRKAKLKAKTVNLALDRVRRILNLAARVWRENGKPWLPMLPPIISMIPDNDGREPMQLTWAGQRKLLPHLPVHLARMVLFDLNTGLRDEPLVNLRWQWEVRIPGHDFSAFVVPKRYVKGRRRDRVVVCNSVAQSIIEGCRGEHGEFVFAYSQRKKKPEYRPVTSMNNTAWHKGRKRAGWPELRIHDLRHTVGMRLREAGVSEMTQDDILWHARKGMTAHYSVAQVVEIRQALELITDEKHANNVSLASLVRQQRVPVRVPAERKTA